MILDAHAHLFHPRWYPPGFLAALVRDYTARLRAAGRHVNEGSAESILFRMLTDDTGSTTVKIMDKAGIDKRIILILDWAFGLGEAAQSIWEIHREILGICAKFPDRLTGFAGVDPRRADAVQLVEWAIDSMGARGLKLHPTSDWTLADEQTRVVVEAAAKRSVPVLAHIGRTLEPLSDRNSQPAALMRLAGEFPGVLFVAGHSGFESWRAFAENEAPPNIVFDVSAWQIFLAEGQERLRAEFAGLYEAFRGRVCFGSDAPFFTYNSVASEQAWVRAVEACAQPLPDEEKACIFNPPALAAACRAPGMSQ